MATIEQVENALRNAHSAGDEKAARALAAELVRLRTQSAQPKTGPWTTSAGVVRGMRDPVDAAAQILYRAVPEGVRQAGDELNNLLAGMGVPLEPIPAGGFEEQLAQQEAAYQEQRQGDGLDTARLAGNIFSPANLALASKVPQAGGLLARTLTNAAAGAGLGLLQSPVVDSGDDFWQSKAQQALGGLVGGAAITPAMWGMSRMIQPAVSKGVEIARQSGIPLTVGQRLGGLAKDIEDKLTSVPILGKTIQNRRLEGYEAFNRAALQRALTPIGKEIPEGLDPQQALAHTRKTLGAAYDDVLGGMTGQADEQFAGEVNRLVQMARLLPEKEQGVFFRTIERELQGRMTPSGRMDGQSLKSAQEMLRKQAEKFSASPDAYQRDLGDAFGALLDSFNGMVTRSNPGKADTLRAINSGYANFKRAQRAAASLGADEGLFTPAQLRNAVRGLDKSKDKRAFAEGTALMQDLADPMRSTLPPKVPDSGTPGRLLAANPLLAAIAAPVGAVTAPLYLQGAQRLMGGLLTPARPPFAQPVAEAVWKGTPYLLPGAAAAAEQLGRPLLQDDPGAAP